MTSTRPKRDIADFFKPYARGRVLPKPTVAQKRPSPPPNDPFLTTGPPKRSTAPCNDQLDGVSSSQVQSSPPKPITPTRQRPIGARESPQTPTFGATTTPSSAQLPIRTPKSTITIQPARTYTTGPAFVKTPASEYLLESRIRSLSPSPEKRVPVGTTGTIDLPTSTQNVVREGKIVAVRDSDEDDSDSLASLTDIFGPRKEDDETSISSPLEEDGCALERERVSTLKLFLNGRSDPAASKQKLRDILALKTSGKRDAKKLFDHQRNYVANARNIEQLREKYETTLRETDDTEVHIDLDSNLESFIKDTDDAEKVIGAVRRTEALSEDLGYSFYGRLGMRDFRLSPLREPQFPSEAVPHQLFQAGDSDTRSNQYLSGIIAQLAGQNTMKSDALKWTFKAFISEPSIPLRSAYVSTLEAAAPYWVRTGIRPHEVQLGFYSLAADLEKMADSKRFELRPQPVKSPPVHAEYLASTLELFAKISAHMSFESLSALASIVAQISIDSTLMDIPSIASGVENLFDNLLGRFCEEEVALHVASHIVSTVPQALHEPTLQVQLLEHIRPTTRVAVNVRITLAHLFLLGVPGSGPSFVASQPPCVDLLRLINLLAVSDDFATGRLRGSLNYSDLRARTVLLDVAISDGGRPAAFPSQQYPKVRDFNRQIDVLAASVRKVWTAIADTGATHMKRTEAKEKLDSVYHRLLYVVRTEAPPKKHMFDQLTGRYGDGDEMRATVKGRETMKSFLAKAEGARRSNNTVKDLTELKVESVEMIDVELKEEPLAAKEKDGDLLALPRKDARIASTPSSVGEFVDAVEHQLPSPDSNMVALKTC